VEHYTALIYTIYQLHGVMKTEYAIPSSNNWQQSSVCCYLTTFYSSTG